MTSSEHAALSPPWISVWLMPRATIERILAKRSQRGVVLIGSLGLVSGYAVQLIGIGLKNHLFNWHIALGLAILGVFVGIVSLYIAGLIFKWAGWLMGGRASAAQVRTVVAWGTAPSILGLIIVLALVVAWVVRDGGDEAAVGWMSIVAQLIAIVFSIWAGIVFALMFSRVQGFGFWRTAGAYALGSIFSIGLSILIAVGVRTSLFQPFSIPSHSMNPTLLVGDNFFVSKYAYGYSHYSIPFSPHWFSGRIFAAAPARGDVAIFRLPKDDSVDYIKRVIGLPGDRVQMKEGLLYINDVAVKREQTADFTGDDACGGSVAAKVKRWRETLPNGVSYETLDCVANGFYDNTNIFEVPAGRFFVMGDNRDNSTDSRVVSFGAIPLDNFVGRAEIIYFSVAPAATSSAARSERLGQIIH